MIVPDFIYVALAGCLLKREEICKSNQIFSMACINDGGWEMKFEFFSPHLWFNCQSVYCLFSGKKINGFVTQYA